MVFPPPVVKVQFNLSSLANDAIAKGDTDRGYDILSMKTSIEVMIDHNDGKISLNKNDIMRHTQLIHTVISKYHLQYMGIENSSIRTIEVI